MKKISYFYLIFIILLFLDLTKTFHLEIPKETYLSLWKKYIRSILNDLSLDEIETNGFKVKDINFRGDAEALVEHTFIRKFVGTEDEVRETI